MEVTIEMLAGGGGGGGGRDFCKGTKNKTLIGKNIKMNFRE